MKRKEYQTHRGIVALLRTAGRWPQYRVSYRYGADYWCEYVAPTRDACRAIRAAAQLVEFQGGLR